MKNVLISFILGIATLHQVSAQDKLYGFTFSLGVSPNQTPAQADLFVNRKDPLNELIFNLADIGRYYQIGLAKNIPLSRPFFATVGLQYSIQREHYTYAYTYKEPVAGITQHLNVTNHVLTMPAGIGVKFNNLDLTSGLQMQYALKSEMKDDYASGIEMTDSKAHLGWYSGIGYSFDRTRIGVQYQSSMNRYGSNLNNSGQSLSLRSVPGNFTFTIGFSF
jgi:hypothetical protein